MHLSITTFNIVNDWPLPRLIEKCRELGISGMEFRLDRNHGHGVETSLTKDERREVRERIEDAYMTVVGIGSSARFDKADKTELRNEIALAKESVDLCADLGGKFVRVYGNDINKDIGRDATTAQIGESLAELIPYGRQRGVETVIEMHGQYNNFHLALAALNASGIRDAGLIYNSDPNDVIRGTISQVYAMVRDKIKLVHVHDLNSDFPYRELFRLLYDDGYDGYISAELPASPDPERVLSYFAAMYRLMIENISK